MESITTVTVEADKLEHIYLRQWLQNMSLSEALENTEQRIRKEPENPKWRSIHIDLLCVLRYWPRALKSLETYIKLAPGQKQNLIGLEKLIKAEMVREAVFAGEQVATLYDTKPLWFDDFASALACNAKEDHEQADKLRASALGLMETDPDFVLSNASGFQSNIGSCDWLVDSDSRLSAVFEFVSHAGYRWIPIYNVMTFEAQAPSSLLDLIWLSATISTREQPDNRFKVYVPARYPALKNHVDSDNILLSKLTQWLELGDCSVFASGQKTFLTSGKDWPLFELRYWNSVTEASHASQD